jgi:hypothetical protein
MAKITFGDKTDNRALPQVAATEKVSASDINQIKWGVNATIDGYTEAPHAVLRSQDEHTINVATQGTWYAYTNGSQLCATSVKFTHNVGENSLVYAGGAGMAHRMQAAVGVASGNNNKIEIGIAVAPAGDAIDPGTQVLPTSVSPVTTMGTTGGGGRPVRGVAVDCKELALGDRIYVVFRNTSGTTDIETDHMALDSLCVGAMP